ncbi:glycosyltransferase family 2 protein [Methylotuvimicrobium sp. KM2]|uniref:glycosyltransferase family 2 protein n=1 Tax=Methylotuvimicrobium sp. KM2 TaxID=3133976 RepID=UPI003100E987
MNKMSTTTTTTITRDDLDKGHPKISIVTPSFNQGKYIEETIESVINQNYDNLEYIIIDGNSSDGTQDIIKKYDKYLSYWISEPDNGQYHAINKGFSKSSGEIMAWINSDDKYTPWALSVVAEIFSTFPEIEWLTTGYGLLWDQSGRAVFCRHRNGYNRQAFFKGAYLAGTNRYNRGFIQQESTFWRRSLWEKAGSQIDSNLRMAGDFELWSKFFQHSELYVVNTPLAGFRSHDEQKTANQMKTYIKEAEDILKRSGKTYPYSNLENSVRTMLFQILGNRSISKNALPSWFAYAIQILHVFYSVKQCVWSSTGWKIHEAYIA